MSADARPNLVFLFTDQQTGRATGADGWPHAATPNLDRLAAGGRRFTRSYCASPLCSPSRASLATGMFPSAHGVTTNHLHLPEGVAHLGGVLGAAGYETVWAGKWHVPEEYPLPGPTIPGFTTLDLPGRQLDHNAYPVRIAGRPGNWEHNLGDYADEPVAEAAAAFLRRPHDRPFLLAVSLMNPHDICFPPAYDRVGVPDEAKLPPLPANFAPPAGEPAFAARTRFTHEWVCDWAKTWDERGWRVARWIYDRFMERADRAAGIVLDGLRVAGLERDTVVLFTSDHGEGVGAHQWTGKLMLYEEPMTVPFILSRPGSIAPGVDDRRLVSGVDVLPTLCGYAGVAPPPGLHGENLRPLVEDPAAAGREFLVAELHPVEKNKKGGGRMVRTARFKYAVFAEGEPSEMLFDLDRDPGETTSLAADPAFRAELDRHRALLRGWLERTGDSTFPFSLPR